MENNAQKNINKTSKQIQSDIVKQGVDAIKDLFSEGKSFKERVEANPEKEYVKKMLISQMDIDGMLLTHKYAGVRYNEIPAFREESGKITEQIRLDSQLVFNEDTIEALFGNSLDITSEEECERFRQLCEGTAGIDITTLYTEEKFKSKYENEKNVIKKFIQGFKYKKMIKQNTLEESSVKKAREVIRKIITENPEENAGYLITKSGEAIQKGIFEYKGLQELEDITKITLVSLQQKEGELINIEAVCKKTRNIMQERSSSKFDTNYRQKQVTIGTDRGISKGPVIATIPFEEIPAAMQDLQQRYENAYNISQSDEEYISEISKIYADFVYIQPYEDGNKRTATCLLNSMLLSKGILPPPISLSNDGKELGKAFSNAHDKDYTMLQDMIVSRVEETKIKMGKNANIQTEASKINDNKETGEVDR